MKDFLKELRAGIDLFWKGLTGGIGAVVKGITSFSQDNFNKFENTKSTKYFSRKRKQLVKTLREWGLNYRIWLVVVGLIVAAEATLFWASRVGIYINALALAGLAALAVISDKSRKVAISASIIPVANMVVASVMPKSIIGSTVILYSVILLLSLIYRYMFTLEYPELKTALKLKGYGYGLPIMIVTGEVVGAIAYLFLRHHYPFVGYSWPLIALAAVAFAFTEEMLLRGLIQQQGEIIFRPAMAAIATTILYVFLTLNHSTWLTFPVALIMGGVLSFTYYKRKNIILTFTINATAKLIYIGLVVSFVLKK
ncbi:MAG TPA: CPBP family intramembrane glutamic endopeptidase [Candidatus Sulfotelmatobacter sp.]|nr:CPBP family intramembrane glutamic endopeptidase [Candidatus Sulfotelmatobacter sp.]